MPKIKVLVVDDSVVMRRILAKNLAMDPTIDVVGYASNGRLALAKISQLNPDLVTLDIEMPEMDGLMALSEIRKSHPKLPVIMVSAIDPRAVATTLDALTIGANDYVLKPTHAPHEDAEKRLRDELIPKIKSLCGYEPKVDIGLARKVSAEAHPKSLFRDQIDILAIGVSTGGPNALTEVLTQFPSTIPVPIVIVQHMPPVFTRLLAERLMSKSRIPVYEANSGAVLKPGTAWLAPGDFHMEVKRLGQDVRIELHQRPPENACRPSVDVLFRSVASVYGAHSLAVIMTGMGHDGLHGCLHIQEAGGQIIAQDEATSVVWGMPGAVAREGLADKILPLQSIAGEIVERVQRSRIAQAR